jgi:hypothetical protein
MSQLNEKQGYLDHLESLSCLQIETIFATESARSRSIYEMLKKEKVDGKFLYGKTRSNLHSYLKTIGVEDKSKRDLLLCILRFYRPLPETIETLTSSMNQSKSSTQDAKSISILISTEKR